MAKRTLPPLVMAVAVASCEETGTGPNDHFDDVGSFQVTVSGGIDDVLQGHALWGAVEPRSSGHIYLVIELLDSPRDDGDARADYRVVFVQQYRGLPLPATYPLVAVDSLEPPPQDPAGFFLVMQGVQPIGVFAAASGTLTLESATPSELRGQFSFSAAGRFLAQPNQTITLSVSGNFRAVAGPVVLPRI